jgi:hypothetical protein
LIAVLAAALAAASGIAGTVVIDPARPVCEAGQSCSAPDAHDTLLFWRGTTRVGRAQTTAEGTFRISLPPGRYRITFPRRTTIRAQAATVRVVAGTYAHARLSIDIGIR